MRDVNRIHGYCERLEAIWSQYPDLRLGQLMSNLLGVYYSETKRDPFFPEDEEFMSVIEKMYARSKE